MEDGEGPENSLDWLGPIISVVQQDRRYGGKAGVHKVAVWA